MSYGEIRIFANDLIIFSNAHVHDVARPYIITAIAIRAGSTKHDLDQ